MKQGTPPEPVITYDHTGPENPANDPKFRLVSRILLFAECALLATLIIAMFNLY